MNTSLQKDAVSIHAEPRLFTSHITVVFVDTVSGELRHGPLDGSPPNVFLVRNGDVAQLQYVDRNGKRTDIVCLPEYSAILGSETVRQNNNMFAGSTFSFVPISRGTFALSDGGQFLCAEYDGRITKSRSVCREWETFHFGNAMHWSDTVDDYYPVNPRPRWGHGQPAHAGLRAILERSRGVYEAGLDVIAEHRAALHAVPHDPDPSGLEPHWNNIWFTSLDAAALVSFLLARRPAHYVEIGSGNSTLFAHHAKRWGGLSTHLTSIDPQPRIPIDSMCDRVVRQPLEECDLNVFAELQAGDVLFSDGSHRIFTNSDVATLFLDVLPRLPPGILVHVHDVFLPYDYPPEWNNRLYSEHYLIAAMLLCRAPPFRVLMPNYFVCMDIALGNRVKNIFRADNSPDIPFLYPNNARIPGVSFWFETL